MDCVYEDCPSKRIQLRGKYVLKTGEVRLRFRCWHCERWFDDRLIPKEERTRWSQEMEGYLYSIMSGELKPECLKKAKGITSTTLHKALNNKFGPNVIHKAGIQLRMNNFMKKHGVSSLPLSPSSDLQ